MGRKRIGIVYIGGKGWIGGVYYIQNVINALNTLDEDVKPTIDAYCDSTEAFETLSKITQYPHLVFNQYRKSWPRVILGKIARIFSYSLSRQIGRIRINKEDSFVFPEFMGNPNKVLPWIADFQEKHLPQNFSEEMLEGRERKNRYISEHDKHLVLSSEDCKNDFEHFYPQYKCKIHVLHFAVTLPDYSSVDIQDLRKKFGIKENYLFCPNQFWKHKNHLFLFKAYKKALDKGLNLQLVCTGELKDYRNPQYISQIKDFIESNNLSQHIKILGFIQREEMLCLIANAHAVVQPSLFEGWSTVVEDAKAVNKFIFLSDLKVHREQIDKNVCFFNPFDEEDLCDKLLTVKPTHEPRDYAQDVRKFGENFLSIIREFDN
jgi:glycosyltransferase involved in cell wall biosynthesis